MLPKCLPTIRQALSDPRLDAYRLTPSENDLDLMARYAWNMDLCAALYPTLHLLEVVLRNSLNAALIYHHSGDMRWYEQPSAFSTTKSPHNFAYDNVQKAIARVSKVAQPFAPDAPGRVVAELNFGFWTSLLSKQYGSPKSVQRNWRPLWPDLVPKAFPHFPAATGTKRDREVLATRFDNIRKLRNRVSHHESIWKGRPDSATNSMVRLDNQFQEIIEALGWMSPEVVYAATTLSNFMVVLNAGPAPYRIRLESLP